MARKLFSQRSTPNAIQSVEELAKLKRPISSMMAAETGSSIPFIVPGTSFKSMDAPKQQPKEEAVPELTDYSQLLPQEQQQQQQSAGMSIQEFLGSLGQQSQNGPIGQSQDGGFLFKDGTTRYLDGSIKTQMGEKVYPVASAGQGKLLYSDNKVRYGGLESLVTMIFGQNQDITQQYGNINPIEPTKGNVNLGTDIRTRNLTGEQRDIALPFEARVVQVLNDDGTRFGDISGHKGYGNSVLVELPSGEMLRFSHLTNKGNFQVGDVIPANATIGTPGTTGNTYGEHLDLEYYNAQGQIDDPQNFKMGAEVSPVTPGDEVSPTMQTQPQGQVLGTQQETQQPIQQIQPTQPSRMNQVIDKAATQFGNVAGKSIEALNPTGRFDLGVSETLQGNKPAAQEAQRQTIEGIGTLTKAPEMYTGELSKMQGTDPFRQALGNVTDYMGNKLKQLGINTEDLGLKNVSEKIAGGKTTFSQGMQDVLSPIMKSIPTSQAYAADTSTIPQSGAGIDAMKGSVLGATTRPTPADISPRLAIGDITGPTAGASAQLSRPVASTAQMDQAGPQADIRDPFFKQGLDKAYASLIDPEKAKSGALTMDLFSPEVFQNEDLIKGIFGGTSLQGQADQKYQQYLESIKPKEQPTLQDYLSSGRTAEQWFAETGQQSSLDQLRQSGASLDQIKQSYESSTPNIFPSMNISSEKPNQKSISNFNKTADYSKLSSVKMPDPVKGYSYDMPVQKSSSAQITTKPSGGGVSNIFSAIARLFKR